MTPWSNLLGVFLLYATLWVACLIYLLPLRHRAHYWLRMAFFLALGMGAAAFTGLLHMENGWLHLSFCCLYAFACIWACGETSLYGALYCGAWAVICQQLAVEAVFLCYRSGEPLVRLGSLWWLVGLVLFGLSFSAFGGTVARWMPENGQYKVGPRQVSSALVLLAIFEVLFRILVDDDVFFTKPNALYLITIMLAQCYCVTMLYMQNALFKKSAMKQELATLNRLWYQQKQQYAVSKENIAIINRKCHDLKHQMAAMRTIAVAEDREKYFSEIENSVNIYDAMVQTGNEVLDTVLTEKSLYCEANQIKISCIADGGQLGFMDPIDLYAIFGNALDNAIESVQQLQDMDKRQIDVLIRGERQFLAINIMNPLRQALTFDEDHLPLSTKASDGYHGFGLKSIRHSVKKYGGFVSVSEEDGCFALRILVPLPKTD